MNRLMDFSSLLEPALEQAKIGFEEGGLPVGAALFDKKGALISVGRWREE